MSGVPHNVPPIYSTKDTRADCSALNVPNQMSCGHHLTILVHLEYGVMHTLILVRLMLRFPSLSISDRTGTVP
jgi:hypothetical protein